MPATAEFRLAIYNQKGGIAKTTTTVNLAAGLAALGRSVLVIDLDSQGNATRSLPVDEAADVDLFALIEGAGPMDRGIVPTRLPGVSLLPATLRLAAIETGLMDQLKTQRSLQHLLYSSALPFDFVLFDCPPAFGLLSVNALVAADAVLVPVAPSAFSWQGLGRTLELVKKLQAGINKDLTLEGILLTLMEDDPVAKEFATAYRREHKTVLDIEIPRDRDVVRASTRDLPVVVTSPMAPASLGYLALAQLIARHRPAPPPGVSREDALARLTQWQEALADRPKTTPVSAPSFAGQSRAAAGGGQSRWLWFLAGLVVGIVTGYGAIPIIRFLS
ncbi:MAG: ParA family protein [Alphaproteobacteria bacterium]|nr:MAG: ParA family protein [Alphaproteobacteria bacterium]